MTCCTFTPARAPSPRPSLRVAAILAFALGLGAAAATAGLLRTAMGPGDGVPGNDFRANADGEAEVTIRVPADNDYAMMVVAYHADDALHGESPGEMGEVIFQHLEGPWPGPAND
jgi:hypothetical protein